MDSHSEDCLFCKIIRGDIPSKKVYESENVFAFLDIFPIAEGHTVVVPKNHFYNLLDFPDEEIGPYFIELKKIATILKDKLGGDGFNILQNNFRSAGQVVPHLHYHIIPRKEKDGVIKLKISKQKATDEELDRILSKFN
jgi:histidine triad (HIT) family protein